MGTRKHGVCGVLLVPAFLLAGCFGGVQDGGDAPLADAPAEWPRLADAVVHPGVRVGTPVMEGPTQPVEGMCTANFVFRSLVDDAFFIGAAGHCFSEVGQRVRIGGNATGVVAYDSLVTMRAVREEDETVRALNDFALVRVDPAFRHLTHPGIPHWGGPVGLADAVAPGDRVLAVRNSTHRPDEVETLDAREGEVLRHGRWITEIRVVPPSVSGDSGGPVLTGDGRALGVQKDFRNNVTLTPLADCAACDGIVNLAPALAYLHAHTDLRVELVEWSGRPAEEAK